MVPNYPPTARRALMGAVYSISAGNVQVVFRNGSAIVAWLDGVSEQGVVLRTAAGVRILYPLEWIQRIAAQ